MDCLFFDYDGTLCIDGEISEKNLAALCAVKALGHKIFLNTGRSRGFLPEGVAPLFDGLLCGMTYLEYEGRELFCEVMRKEDVKTILLAAAEAGVSLSVEGADDCYHYLLDRTSSTPVTDMETFVNSPLAERIQKISFARRASLPEGFPTPGLTTIAMVSASTGYPYVEGIPIGYTKATLMEKVGELLGVTRENMIAFGDSANDADMLAYAGRCAVIGHAPPSLDVYRPYRTASEADGVCEAIEHFYNIKV